MFESELEGYTAKDQREKHEQNGEIHGRDDDGESQRESRHQADAAEHQPSFITVPDRRNRIHDDGAAGLVRHEAVKNTDAQIEAVEDHVIEHGEAKEAG